MTNVKNAVAISVLGVGLISLAPLARDIIFGGPISIQPKTQVVSIDSPQYATNIKTIQTNIIAEKKLLTNLERKSEIAKVDELLQNAKPKDIAKLIQYIKTKNVSNNGPTGFETFEIVASLTALDVLVILFMLNFLEHKYGRT